MVFKPSTYSAIRESYDDILKGGHDLHVTLKTVLSSNVYALFTHRDFVLGSHGSILASLWTLKNMQFNLI